MLFWLSFLSSLLFAEKLEVSPKRIEESAKSLLLVVQVRAAPQAPRLEESILREHAIGFLRQKNLPAEWGNPENRSTTQMLKAYFGTMIACGVTIRTMADTSQYALTTLCSASRREFVDKQLPASATNSKLKNLWEKSEETLSLAKNELEAQAKKSLSGVLSDFAANYPSPTGDKK